MSRPFSDCSVVITGGTSGVGLASAIALAEAGVPRIALVGRDQQRGADALGMLLADAPEVEAEFLPCDASDPEQAEAACALAAERLGGIDILLNSTASIYTPAPLAKIPTADITQILLGQALPPLHMSRAALPYITERGGGSIINIASDAAKVPTPGETVLGGAMSAIVTFSRTLAVEAKRQNIRVNCLTPSLIEGTIIGSLVMEHEFSRKLFEKAKQQAHLGVAEPEDLAALVVFLAGPGSAKLTGQVISVNGGISVA